MRQYFEEHEVQCGAPWERVVEKKYYGARGPEEVGQNAQEVGMSRNALGGQKMWDSYEPSKTIGWQPTCSHKAEPVPCVVLDPFAGSFTTKSVAERLGRRGIGLELKWEYIQMGKKRCKSDQKDMFIHS